jgi:mannose-6-phosphate isomerase
MHLLEAALAWAAVTTGDDRTPWSALAGEIVGLCRMRFCDASSGAIREYFDFDWRPAANDAGRIVEPGHQFEWAWLLLEWSALPGTAAAERSACVQTARQLVAAAERWGVDLDRGLAINELWDDMTVKDADARLWPQTERVKAWCALFGIAQTPAEARAAGGALVRAANGLAAFLRADAPGLWHEHNLRRGGFMTGPSRASSLYHIVGAIDALKRAVNDPQRPEFLRSVNGSR